MQISERILFNIVIINGNPKILVLLTAGGIEIWTFWLVVGWCCGRQREEACESSDCQECNTHLGAGDVVRVTEAREVSEVV